MTSQLDTTFQSSFVAKAPRSLSATFAIGTALCIVLAVLFPASFWSAYLVSWLFVIGLGLGCLGLALLHQLTGGQWGLQIVRNLVAGAATVSVATMLMLPLGFGLHLIYPLFNATSASEIFNRNQQFYFMGWIWVTRIVVYFVVWNLLSRLVVRRYRQLEQTGSLQVWCATPRLSAFGLIGLSITVTFAMIDWVMSLEPRWTSTIFAALLAMGFVVCGMAFTLLVQQLPGSEPEWHAEAKPVRTRALDLGNLMLAFLLIWVYLAISQFLIIWSGDLPFETVWYHRRLEGIWLGFALALVLFHFAIPFGCLLSRDVKTSPSAMAAVTAVLLVMRVVDLIWTIIPACPLMDLWWLLCLPVTLTTLGSAWLWVFLRVRRSLPQLIVRSLASVPSSSLEVAAT